jgi:hypothetical protein
MYTHIYTTATSDYKASKIYPDRIINVWWYKQETESSFLFKDYNNVLAKLQEYDEIDTYTGAILEVESENEFIDRLILLGIINPSEPVDITLQDGTTIQMNHGVIVKSFYDNTEFHITRTGQNQFDELYQLCFGEYTASQSFSCTSKMPPINVTNDISRIQNMKGEYIYVQGVQFHKLAYNIIETNIPNPTLTLWFTHARKYMSYTKSISHLERLYIHNMKLKEFQSENQEKSEELQSEELKSEGNSVDRIWVEEFCDLYAEKDEKTDTLLSDIYQQYITASSWTETETLSMSQFTKYLKSLPQFTIKRKAKGMVVTGYKFLLTSHSDIYSNVADRNIKTPNLFQPITSGDIICAGEKLCKIAIKYTTNINEVVEFTKREFYFETVLLLKSMKSEITHTIIRQFINNPIIKPILYKYAEYVKEVTNPTSDIKDKYYSFEKKFNNYFIIFPFSTKHNKNIPITPLEINGYDPIETTCNNWLLPKRLSNKNTLSFSSIAPGPEVDPSIFSNCDSIIN